MKSLHIFSSTPSGSGGSSGRPVALRYRAEGEEKAWEIRAAGDNEREIILAHAYADSQHLRGERDPQATAVTDGPFWAGPGVVRLPTTAGDARAHLAIVVRPDSDPLRRLETPQWRR